MKRTTLYAALALTACRTEAVDPSLPPDPADPPIAPTSQVENAWSDPKTWGGAVPTDGEYVEIQEGQTVTLDGATARLKGLAVKGTLRALDGAELAITSDFVAVEGLLEVGVEADPFDGTMTITLTGQDGAVTPYSGRIGNKALGVIGQGRLALHGVSREKTAWTQVEGDLPVGATSLATADFVNWQEGDRLVIAPSGFDPLEAEEVTVTATNGRRVEFEPALRHKHLGTQQTYGGKTLDNRAEVGLLSRNIVIRGDGTGEFFRGEETGFRAGFGAHAIFMDDSDVRIEGVEFTNSGQTGKPGRYAAHWHLAGDHAGDYVRDSSFHHSFQRAVVMHQSDFVTAEDNVAYFVGNHAFIPAEDGNEDGNVFRRNLSVLNYSPRREHFAFFDENMPSKSSQGEFRSSGFWMRSTNHVFEDNHVAGSWNGMGFFFDRVAAIRNTATSDMVFEGNLAHTIHRTDEGYTNSKTYKEITKGHALMVGEKSSDKDIVFDDFTAYASFGGAWLEDRTVTLHNSILADNGTGVFVMQSVIDDVVVVGESEADVGRIPDFGSPEAFKEFWSGGIQAPPSHGKTRAPVILDATVINQKDAAFVYNRPEIGSGTRIERLRVINTPRRVVFTEQAGDKYWFTKNDGAIEDPNGQLIGDGVPARWARARARIVTDDCRYDADAQAFACDPADSLRIRFTTAGETPRRLIDLADGSVRTLEGRFRRFGYARTDHVYGVRWNSDVKMGSEIAFEATHADGKAVTLAFAVTGPPASVTKDGARMPSVSNMAALTGARSSSYWHDRETDRLYVRVRGGEQSAVRIKAPLAHRSDHSAKAATEADVVPGLRYRTYARGSDGARLKASQLGVVRSSGTSAGIEPALLTSQTNASVVFDGYLEVPVDGYYRFAIATKAHADVYLNGSWMAGRFDDTLVAKARQTGVDQLLEAGLHPVTVVLSHPAGKTNTAGFSLYWRKPGEDKRHSADLDPVPTGAFFRDR